MIRQAVKSREMIEKFTIDKFKKTKDISVLCDKELAEKLVEEVLLYQTFDEVNINYDNSNEFIVSKVIDELIVEPARNELGDYKEVYAPVIILTYGHRMSGDDLDYFLQERELIVLGERDTGALFNETEYFENKYYMEFGMRG